MQRLFSNRTFTGFGPNGLEIVPITVPIHAIHADKNDGLRPQVRLDGPRLPGVYGMLDACGELIYVGKAKCLRTRLLSYFRPKSRDPKAGKILRPTRSIVWEIAPNELAALLRELELIRRWRPRFNVQGQPRRGRRVYVCLGRRPASYVFLAANPPKTALGCFGPVRAGRSAREAVRRLNDWFRLRDCPQAQQMFFADQAELFPLLRTPGCLRHDIGTCLGPCAGTGTLAGYTQKVRAARAFLAGTDLAPLESLKQQMLTASTGLEYERAAVLRDRLESLQWLHDQLERLRRICGRTSFVYPLRTHDGRELWYLIHGGRVVFVTPRPECVQSRSAAEAAIAAVYLHKKGGLALPGPLEMDGVFLVAAWFRRYPEENAATLPPKKVLELCRGRRSCK